MGSRHPSSRKDTDINFKKIKMTSEAPAEVYDHSLSTFFFRGTKVKKLSRKLKEEYLEP